MRPGEGTLAAGRGDHRGLERLRQLAQLAGRVRPYDSPARDDRRPGRVRQQVGRHRREFGARGQLLGKASPPVTTGISVGDSSTSCGISTHTGPCGAVSADFQAASIAEGIWDWARTVCTDFTTPLNEADWSGSSCR